MGAGASASEVQDAIRDSTPDQLKDALASLSDDAKQKLLEMIAVVRARDVTGLDRPSGDHRCKPVEVVAGVWNAHFEDVETGDKLKSVSPNITLVVNCAPEKCATNNGSYCDGVEVMRLEGFLDNPPGDAKREFERVLGAIDAAKSSGGAALLHCHASVSRSVVFILAYMMKTQKITAIDAIKEMKIKWAATWPNDRFCAQLVEYESELRVG